MGKIIRCKFSDFLKTDKQSELLLKNKEYKFIFKFGKDKNIMYYSPYIPLKNF